MKKALKIGGIALLITLVVGCASALIVNETKKEPITEQTVIINAQSSSQDIKLVQKKLTVILILLSI